MSERVGVTAFVHLIEEELAIEEPFDMDTPLVSSGIIDSFDVVALLSIIEMRYHVSILPEQIDIQTFDTPAQMFTQIEEAS